MPEPSTRDGRPQPTWPVCSTHDDDCIGIRIGTTAYCLEHLEHLDHEAFTSFFASLEPGASLDLRGTLLRSELLDQLLAAFRTDEDHPSIIGPAQFDEAQFDGDVSIYDARFIGSAQFDGARFNGHVRFNWLLQENARTRFEGKTSFDEARFNRDADFDLARFKGMATFNRTQFCGHASFNRAQFSSHARFDRARFEADAAFKEAQFKKGASFSGTKFKAGGAEFNLAEFSESAEFDGAQFTAATQLGPLRAEKLLLDSASFGASVVVAVAAKQLSLVGTRFEQETTLWVRCRCPA